MPRSIVDTLGRAVYMATKWVSYGFACLFLAISEVLYWLLRGMAWVP